MAILIIDQKKLEMTAQCKVGESFETTEEAEKFAKELEEIKQSQVKLQQRLTKLLEDCHVWNIDNDNDYKKAVEKHRKDTQKEQGTQE